MAKKKARQRKRRSAHAFRNPFRPGSGHMPPHLAGRSRETEEFLTLLDQDVVLENLVMTGLRGVGKTVLLDTFKPVAMERGWLWAGTDLSETASVAEERIAIRLMADLAVAVSSVRAAKRTIRKIGFGDRGVDVDDRLDYRTMERIYVATPGLSSDKVKAVLEAVWSVVEGSDARGLILAYDEAQNMADHAETGQYPLSLMLDVFQSIQKKGIPFMLILTGLPTLFPKLVEARTYSERMFHVMFLDSLNAEDSRDAITRPISVADCPVKFTDDSVDLIVHESGGYPYFIQFMCREAYDVFVRHPDETASVPMEDIVRKLDTDFFAGRWSHASDRQRDLMMAIAALPNCGEEFTIQEVSRSSHKILDKGFSPSHISQMFVALQDAGLIYKNRHGKYSFAVPMMGAFVLRQMEHQSS